MNVVPTTSFAEAMLGRKSKPIDPDAPPKGMRALRPGEVRKIRRRNQSSQTKKATRSYRRRQFAEAQELANMTGVARVYFNRSTTASDAMRRNVVARVQDLAETLSTRDEIPYTKALKQVEKTLHSLIEKEITHGN